MARSERLSRIRKLLRRCLSAPTQADDALRSLAEEATSRRGFIRALAAGAGVTVAIPSAADARNRRYWGDDDDDDDDDGDRRSRRVVDERVEVAVIGAGVAGSTAAWRMAEAGVHVGLYEARDRVGGRAWTRTFANGQKAEMGPELVDSNHAAMHALCEEFDLPLIDRFDAIPPGGTADVWVVDGQIISEAEIEEQFQEIIELLVPDIEAAFSETGERYATLDATPLGDYLRDLCLVQTNNPELYEILYSAYRDEYGFTNEGPKANGALNFLFLITAELPFSIFGESDERFHILNGSQTLPQALTEATEHAQPGSLHLEHELVQAKANRNGFTILRFKTPRGIHTVRAEYVIFSLPFSVLERGIRTGRMRLWGRPLGQWIRKVRGAIFTLDYGENAKVAGLFTSDVWRQPGGGVTYTNEDGALWHTYRNDPAAHPVWTQWLGVDRAVVASSDLVQQDPALWFECELPFWDTLLPGVEAAFTGEALSYDWLSDPYILGSYASFLVNQYDFYDGRHGEPVGTWYFCGGHTSLDWTEWMEGAAETAESTAAAVLMAMEVPLPKHCADWVAFRTLGGRLPHPAFANPWRDDCDEADEAKRRRRRYGSPFKRRRRYIRAMREAALGARKD